MTGKKPYQLSVEENWEAVYDAVNELGTNEINSLIKRWEGEKWCNSVWHLDYFRKPEIFDRHKVQVITACKQVLTERLLGVVAEPNPRGTMKREFKG